MVGLWMGVSLLLAGGCFSAWAIPLTPEADGPISMSTTECAARQKAQAQEQVATGGLEAGQAQSWSEECPSLPRPTMTVDAQAEEKPGGKDGELATGDEEGTDHGPQHGKRGSELAPAEVGSEEVVETKIQDQWRFTTITTTSPAHSPTPSLLTFDGELEGFVELLPSVSPTEKEQHVPLTSRGEDALATPKSPMMVGEGGRGKGNAPSLSMAAFTSSSATDGQRDGKTVSAEATPGSATAMPTIAPPSEGPSGLHTDGRGATQMVKRQRGDLTLTRGQTEGGIAHTQAMPGGAWVWQGGSDIDTERRGWEATATNVPQKILVSPDTENEKGGAEFAMEHPTLVSVASEENVGATPLTSSVGLEWGVSQKEAPVPRSWEGASGANLGAKEGTHGRPLQQSMPTPQADSTLAETWTESPGGHEEGLSVQSSSPELGTEPAISSEDLPLIFEPSEEDEDDATQEQATAPTMPPSGTARATQPVKTTASSLAEADLERVVTMDADRLLTESAFPTGVEWLSSWQTSGVELAEGADLSRQPISATSPGGLADAEVTQNSKLIPPTSTGILSAGIKQQNPMATVTKAPYPPVARPKTGLKKLESEEEEDEENEDTTDSEEEEESDEDLTDAPAAAPAPSRPPYSLIPPPPVWLQHNQGLGRSWVELIREKAGYVSGMLAPVGIGIAGALLIVGALYSIRLLHRRRTRNSFKHQRRKGRQVEQQPHEVRTGQDQAMLLADSSEDEF